jgi:hypothetical protein
MATDILTIDHELKGIGDTVYAFLDGFDDVESCEIIGTEFAHGTWYTKVRFPHDDLVTRVIAGNELWASEAEARKAQQGENDWL